MATTPQDPRAKQLSGFLMPLLSNDMAKLATEQIAAAARPKTPQELRTEQILATLDELGGRNVGEDSIVFTGTQVILPEDMQGKMDKVINFLQDYEEGMETHFNMHRTFNYRPYDVAAAFDRAMRRVFGTSGIGKAQFSFFGVTPPEYISVNSGPHGETIQVPWEKVEFSLLEADFYLEEARSAEYGRIGRIRVEAPKKNRKRIEGFFKVVEEELRERSIYRGHAITAHPTEPQFIDLGSVDPARVIYTQAVETQLEVNLWAPLRYTQTLRDTKVPLKRAVLLHGPNGCLTGQTEIAVNRGGKGFTVKIEDLVRRFNGEDPRYSWDQAIPTMVQREMPDGTIRLGRISSAWFSGRKDVFEVVTDKGRSVRATAEHPFLTTRGWLELGDLKPGDEIHVRGEQAAGEGTQRDRDERAAYPTLSIGKHHPYGKGTPDSGYQVGIHRLTVEADRNGYTLDEFVAKVKHGDIEGLVFIDPTRYVVHHDNEDTSDNRLDNLVLMTHREHAALHSARSVRNVLFKTATETVASITPAGEELTWDLEVDGEPRNFLANGFVVHNTGKTLAGGLAGLLATQNGWTYILVRAQDDPLEALNTARMYSPAVVMIEDLDKMASSNQDRDQITMVLDRLDNVEAKGAEVMVVFTSNYAGKLDKNVIRPGRLDAVIKVEALDAPGYQRLVVALIPERLLSQDVNWDEVSGSMDGFLPAFATEAIQRAMRYSIARNHGRPDVITTQDLVAAANGMAEHIALMDAATHADDDKPALDEALMTLVTETLAAAKGRFVPARENEGIHSIFDNVAVNFDGEGVRR